MPKDLRLPLPQSTELRDLWSRYKASGDDRARERLVVTYSPLVMYVAGRMSSGLPGHVDEAELISYGLGGLLSAIERFDVSREIKFETYAITRIRGAIIDELRTLDWVPRSVRARAREIERVNMKLEAHLQRAPTDEELAAELQMSVSEFQDALLQISNSTIVALDELWTVSDEPWTVSDAMSAAAQDPAHEILARDTELGIRAALDDLPEGSRTIALLRLNENLNLNQIAARLGLTPEHVETEYREMLDALAVKGLLDGFSHETTRDPSGRPVSTDSSAFADLELRIDAITEELIEALALRPALLYSLDPRKFEELIARLYARRGFDVTLTPSTNDRGIDLLVVGRNELGSSLTVVQCKRYRPTKKIGVNIVRELHGALVQTPQASRGVLLTTSFFTRAARRLEQEQRYILSLQDFVDLQTLLRLPLLSANIR